MLYILDTDHVSLLQRQHPVVLRNLLQIPFQARAVAAITLAEQTQGRLAAIHRAKTEMEASRSLQYLIQTVEFYRGIHVLPYEHNAVAQFERLRRLKLRVGTQDLRIAATALANHATVVTRNRRDFMQVPKLVIVDWSIESTITG